MLTNIAVRAARTGLVATICLLAACASEPKVRIDKDANVNFAEYKTFAWYTPPPAPSAAAQSDAAAKSETADESAKEAKPAASKVNSLTESRVHTAIADVLTAKGYVFDADSPGFRVNYLLNVSERPKDSGMRIGLGAGGGSGNVAGGVGLSIPIGKRTNTVGAMTIDIIDSQRNSQVWTGFYEAVLKEETLSDADAKRLAETILAKFPAHASQ